MEPGEWIVRCHRGEIERKGDKISAVLTASVLGKYTERGFEKKYEGVVLKPWYSLGKVEGDENDVILDISPYSKYGAAWSLAMGRPLSSKENSDPKAFKNKIFRVDVGFRSNAGATYSYKNFGRKKDARDFLRIHEIHEKIEEKALTHMTPLTMSMYMDMNMTHEHQH